MSNDVLVTESTVVAIQGFAVSDETPTDGYVLTYDDGYAEWQPKPIPTGMTGLRKDYFTSSGTWVCPPGVTSILVIGAGGGGSGSGGGGYFSNAIGGLAGGGGGAALQQTSYLQVTPNTTYNINIGSGGSGVSGGSVGNFGNPGNDGGSTTITVSSTVYFSALGGGGAGATASDSTIRLSGTPFAGNQANGGWYFNEDISLKLALLAGSGGSTNTSATSRDGMKNYVGGYSGGTAGANSTGKSCGGGAGGGAGPQGNGGNGGNGSTGSAGSNGTSAGANTAAGGGGGGSGNNNGAGGNSGAGGSGYLYIIY